MIALLVGDELRAAVRLSMQRSGLDLYGLAPRVEAVARLALAAGLSLDWLAFGRFGELERRVW